MNTTKKATFWRHTGRQKFLLPVLCFLCVAFLSSCAPAKTAQPIRNDGRLRVVTTLFPYYDFVRQIAGDSVDLTLVVPAGMDSHSFEPTPADMRLIRNADLLICNGGSMEHWLEEVLEAIDAPNLRVVTMMDYVDAVEEETVEGMQDADEEHEHADGEHHDHDHHDGGHHDHNAHEGDHHDHDGHELEIEYDEHIWTSPVNAMVFVSALTDILCEEVPEKAPEYCEAAGFYLGELADIDAGFREIVGRRVRNMIVVGDKFPFRYLADEYGLEYRAAFSGCSDDTEPSAQTIAYLIEKIRSEEIPVIYYLELSSHRVSEIIGEETGAQPLLLHSCHSVTRAEFERGITYEELMRRNIVNLRKGID